MQEAREDKHHHTRCVRAPASSNERPVDMSPHEMVHGLIPRAPVHAHGGGVPPLGVELAVAEAHNLRQRVQGGLEDGEEAREPDDEGGG